MDNSLKTKEKTQTGGLTPPTRVKTFLIGNPRGPQGSRKIAGPAPAREPDEGDLSTPGQVGCEIVVPPRRSRSDSIRLPPGSPRSGRHSRSSPPARQRLESLVLPGEASLEPVRGG